jgi:hypothetical protein
MWEEKSAVRGQQGQISGAPDGYDAANPTFQAGIFWGIEVTKNFLE